MSDTVLVISRVFGETACSGGGHCESVASLILRMSGMTFYPMECDAVPSVQREEPLPEIGILHFRKAFLLPSVQPALVDCVDDI